ncbi:acetyltransferase [Lysinibacillus odysseyi 34hs-1 = NBRC 100172]|uniref:Acetyltransferase n=1 Tax=Lysinibacillus odysseyi 34hs-1 = NBRC 100172 TaxID=1220589 RepID=A0A0A3JBW8_9BACI|nr:acetyltransferase [Lysinibacillus odysseyi 34hs-1 = NBRC 100172]
MKEKECPKCHNSQIEKGMIRSGNAVVQMFSYNNARSLSSPISSYYCSNCGYVLGLYVENPGNIEK